MAITCNTGYSELVKKGVGEASDAFAYVAIGTGTGQTAASTTLATESAASGLARAAATATSETTTVTDDTMQWYKVWTSGATATITEWGVFNNAVKDAGDMMMYAELSPSAALVSGDTLTITGKCQLKAG
jgi:hypothetical protein